MSGRDPLSRSWTHRRLGIGAEQISGVALAETDAMLSRIGARHSTTSSSTADPDPFSAALLEFAYDLDRVAGVAVVDATPVAPELLRIGPATVRTRRVTWRGLVPAMSGSLAAVVVVLAILLSQSSSTPVAPSLSVTAQSRQLLDHAGTLLAAAAKAGPAQRTRLVTEAKADLTHVTRLLPLAPPPARSGIRQSIHELNRRMRPFAPPRPSSGGSGSASGSGSSAGSGSGADTDTDGDGGGTQGTTRSGTGSPPRRQPPAHRPPAQGTGSEPTTQTSSPTTAPAPIHSPPPASGQAPPPQRGAPSGPGQQPPPEGSKEQ